MLWRKASKGVESGNLNCRGYEQRTEKVKFRRGERPECLGEELSRQRSAGRKVLRDAMPGLSKEHMAGLGRGWPGRSEGSPGTEIRERRGGRGLVPWDPTGVPQTLLGITHF